VVLTAPALVKELAIMTDLSPIDVSNPPRVAGLGPAGRDAHQAGMDQAAVQPIRRGDDRVEVSALATYLSKLKQLPAIRQGLVDSVRDQIAQGSYETPEKIDAAVEELLTDL